MPHSFINFSIAAIVVATISLTVLLLQIYPSVFGLNDSKQNLAIVIGKNTIIENESNGEIPIKCKVSNRAIFFLCSVKKAQTSLPLGVADLDKIVEGEYRTSVEKGFFDGQKGTFVLNVENSLFELLDFQGHDVIEIVGMVSMKNRIKGSLWEGSSTAIKNKNKIIGALRVGFGFSKNKNNIKGLAPYMLVKAKRFYQTEVSNLLPTSFKKGLSENLKCSFSDLATTTDEPCDLYKYAEFEDLKTEFKSLKFKRPHQRANNVELNRHYLIKRDNHQAYDISKYEPTNLYMHVYKGKAVVNNQINKIEFETICNFWIHPNSEVDVGIILK